MNTKSINRVFQLEITFSAKFTLSPLSVWPGNRPHLYMYVHSHDAYFGRFPHCILVELFFAFLQILQMTVQRGAAIVLSMDRSFLLYVLLECYMHFWLILGLFLDYSSFLSINEEFVLVYSFLPFETENENLQFLSRLPMETWMRTEKNGTKPHSLDIFDYREKPGNFLKKSARCRFSLGLPFFQHFYQSSVYFIQT